MKNYAKHVIFLNRVIVFDDADGPPKLPVNSPPSEWALWHGHDGDGWDEFRRVGEAPDQYGLRQLVRRPEFQEPASRLLEAVSRRLRTALEQGELRKMLEAAGLWPDAA